MTNMNTMRSQRNPVLRSNLYKLFSIGFRYPTRQLFKTFQNGEFLDEIIYNISSIPEINALMQESSHMVKNKRDPIKGMTFAEFEMKFIRTFDAGIPAPPCPPYESHYSGKPGSMVMLEVSEFYSFFGLRMNREEDKREFPDHISAELEFLHFLTFEEGNALRGGKTEKLKGYLLAEKDFLERHLVQWVPGFCLKLQNSEGLPFYPGLAQIVSGFISSEFELLIANMHKSNCEK